MYSTNLKCIFDLLITLLALLLLAPLLLMTALLVRLKLSTPVLFCQQRPGLHGKPFTLYKFRTMTDARDKLASPLETVLQGVVEQVHGA